MSENHEPIWTRINTIAGDIIRLQERSAARTEEVSRLERRVARIELALITIGVGGVVIVVKQIAEGAGVSL